MNLGNTYDSASDGNIDSPVTPRRTVRVRNKPKKYQDFFEATPTKRTISTRYRNITSDESTDDSIDELNIETLTIKPKALFGSDDVEGQDMFKFKSRHTKLDLQNKVKEAIGSPIPNTPKTPKRIKHLVTKDEEATPKQVVNLLKKRIIKKLESDSEESDFSASSSDFVPDKSENESSSDSSSETEAVEKHIAPIVRNRCHKAKQKDSEYIVTPDNYFMMNSSKKGNGCSHIKGTPKPNYRFVTWL
ncbi:uncharacterized protein LOC111000998 isoform X3 [Pieris rapae]|uniref:uncharacterized protein LOC111000998 isoform X3 n=1 Tax=Pieris rapae TaxID=64459 RepID=UPI001E280622|nr:uncharacterized protein LOC111000998 isoform X3 [Pieris rapae]